MEPSVGDWVVPDAETDFLHWDGESKLKVISVSAGKRAGRHIVVAVDAKGTKYTGTSECFKKVSFFNGK
ncbi:hypothetical protein [Acinetobacter colistiniresistens]|uniref:hypothetical protein n=1 Tax=Acinetobacter colistiniresistens TaxID=280145 RepID=UPI00124F85B3|nr:hypothetical protein [Acinetobacter colistiniresistens]